MQQASQPVSQPRADAKSVLDSIMRKMSFDAKTKTSAPALTEEQIKSALKDAIGQAIKAHSGKDVKEIKKSNTQLISLHDEVKKLRTTNDKGQVELVDSYDKLIDNIHNNSEVLKQLKNVYSKADFKKQWDNFKGGLFSQINPVVATGFKVAKAVYDFSKEAGKAQALDERQLKGVEALADKVVQGNTPPKQTKVPPKPKDAPDQKPVNTKGPAPVQPTPVEVKAPDIGPMKVEVEQPKAEKAKRVVPTEGPMVKAMRAVQLTAEEQTKMLERIVVALEATKTTQSAVSRVPPGQGTQTPPKLTKREKRQVEISRQSAVKVDDVKPEPKMEQKIEFPPVLDKLSELDSIRAGIDILVDYNKQQLEAQKQASIDANKRSLDSLDDGKQASAKALKVAPTGLKTPDASKDQPQSGGFLSNMLSEIIGEVIGNKLGGKGKIFSKIGGGIKSALSFLNPKNLVAGVGSLVAKGKGLASSVGSFAAKGATVAAGAFGAVKAAGSGLLGKGAEMISGMMGKGAMLLKGAKAIPIIGQAITAILAITDFVGGFRDASKILDKPELETTLWDKISAGFAKVVGGFVSIVDGLAWVLGFDTDFASKVTKSLAKTLSELPDKMINWFDDFFTGFYDNFKISMLSMAKGVLAALPGGETLVKKLGLDDKIKDIEANKGKVKASEQVKGAFEAAKEAPSALLDKVTGLGTSALTTLSSARDSAVDALSGQMSDAAGMFANAKDAVSGFFSSSKDNQRKIEDAKANGQKDGKVRDVNVVKGGNTTVNNNTMNVQPIAIRNQDDAWKSGMSYGFPM